MSTLELGQANLAALAVEILGGGSRLRFRARGASMQPFIRDGDILEVRPPGITALQRGDVVLCRLRGGRLVAHRVVQIMRDSGTAIVTQGDALACPDASISVEQVLGHVAVVERAGKRIRLDTHRQRLAGLLWMRLFPWRQRLHSFWAAFIGPIRYRGEMNKE
jgi:signal peptidase I